MPIGDSNGDYYETPFDAIQGSFDQFTPSQQYNFETKLAPAREQEFQSWKKENAPNDSGFDYDFRGAFQEGIKAGPDNHWPDTWKKPNHPTFSDQSVYYSDNMDKAGSWANEDGTRNPTGTKFIPPILSPNKRIENSFGDVTDAFKSGTMDAQGQNMHSSFISEKSDLQIAGETKLIQAGTGRTEHPLPGIEDFHSELTKGTATEPPKEWAEWLKQKLPGYEPLHSVDPETGKFKGWGYLVADMLPALNLIGGPVKPIPRPPTGPRSQFTGLDPKVNINTETIKTPAIRAKDGTIFEGQNHSDAFMKATDAGYTESHNFQLDGFVTSSGRFVGRKEAYAIAEKSSQLDKSVTPAGDYLMSHQINPEAHNTIVAPKGKGPEPMTPQRHETLSIAEQDARSIRKEQYNAQKEQRFSEARKRYTEDGLTVEEIEAETGIPRSSLTRNFKANDVQMRPSNSTRKGEWDFTQAKEMFSKGQSFQQIADHFKLSRSTIAGRLSRAGIRKEAE